MVCEAVVVLDVLDENSPSRSHLGHAFISRLPCALSVYQASKANLRRDIAGTPRVPDEPRTYS